MNDHAQDETRYRRLHEASDDELFGTPVCTLRDTYGVSRQAVYSLRHARTVRAERAKVTPERPSLREASDADLNRPLQEVMEMFGVSARAVTVERRVRAGRSPGRPPGPVRTVPDDALFGQDPHVLAESIGVSPSTVYYERSRRTKLAKKRGKR